ncbi:UrcA family protein [Oceanicaulis sp. MMSF_3324]|uniref:UrcA family protein n=1 Tax=Oceanicaulis sp. MMSF_3324 TaxID=3046702 RepID=UPI00273EABA9|nr:UrcA family protein [Oceanicaulis sp. MMSF_3324]
MSILTVMLVSAAGLSLSTVSDASEPRVEETESVNYANELLLTDEGVQQVRGQIASAARSVCLTNGHLTARFSQDTRRCIENAYGEAIEQLEVRVAEARQVSRSYAQAVVNSAEAAQ